MPSAGVMEQLLDGLDEHGKAIAHARRVVLGHLANGDFPPTSDESVRWVMDQLSLTFHPLPARASVCDGSRDVATGILRTGTVTGWLGRKVTAALEDEWRLADDGLLVLPEPPFALASGTE